MTNKPFSDEPAPHRAQPDLTAGMLTADEIVIRYTPNHWASAVEPPAVVQSLTKETLERIRRSLAEWQASA